MHARSRLDRQENTSRADVHDVRLDVFAGAQESEIRRAKKPSRLTASDLCNLGRDQADEKSLSGETLRLKRYSNRIANNQECVETGRRSSNESIKPAG